MVNETKDQSWETVSGLPDDFDFVIESARFEYRDEYQGGEVCLMVWYGSSPDEDVESIIWPCGNGWISADEGARAEHPKRNRFVNVSMMGRLINRVVGELGVDMKSRGSAVEAKVWAGLGFHMKRETLEFGPGILEDRGGKTQHLMPVAVLDKKAGAKATTEAQAGTETTDATDTPAPSSDGVVKKLELLASKLSKDEFQSKAMDMAEVVDNDSLLAQVLDDSDEGFWAKHQA
jgi:hypothetical protein